MAQWILARPRDCSPESEQRVAEALSHLDDQWFIRWGFLYSLSDAGLGEYEGDFIIQGPAGHILVLEAKGGFVRNFVLTGRWESEGGGDSPWVQVNNEWQWAKRRAQSVRGVRPMPFFQRALALPTCNFVAGDVFGREIPRDHVADGRDLKSFPQWWAKSVATTPLHGTVTEARSVFLDAFSEGTKPKSIRFFMRQTEGIFEQQVRRDTGLLRLLDGNRQLLVEGGVGSGKTCLAVRQARHYAEKGLHTLVLCYNLALAQHLRESLAENSDQGGVVEVKSWQELASEILAEAKIRLEDPKEYQVRTNYFTVEVPWLLWEIIREGKLLPRYDALVVDEAQDHDTQFDAAVGAPPDVLGWWQVYFTLLKEGSAAPISLFYDAAQRPAFRNRERFDAERLREKFSQSAHIRLPVAHRFTRPLHAFLKTLANTGAAHLVQQLGIADSAPPEGPEVELVDAGTDAGATMAAIVQRWEQAGFCHPKDVVVLGRRSHRSDSELGDREAINGVRLVNYSADLEKNEVRYLSINKSKGLDFLAVVVIGLPKPEECVDRPDWHELLFMAASRARQVLAVVWAPVARKDPNLL